MTAGSTISAPDPRTGPPTPVDVPESERRWLLDVARAAIRSAVGIAGSSEVSAVMAARPDHDDPPRCAAAFVTLTAGGELRGCIGRMDPAQAVGDAVGAAAFDAARSDPRFEPLAAGELPGLRVDVSVLGPLRPLTDPADFRPGVDGLLLVQGWQRGLLLPEVATMAGLDGRGMLEATCRKAGLSAGAWRHPSTGLFTFRTARFGGPGMETAVGGRVPADGPGDR